MPAYVPPSRRPGFIPKETDTPPWSRSTPKKFKTIEDHLARIEGIFNTYQQGTFNHFCYEPEVTTVQERLGYTPRKEKKTYPPHPLGHVIAYIMIFPRAQPLWESGAE
jgi:hypothetical protein